MRMNELTRIVRDARADAAKHTSVGTDAYHKHVREYISGHARTNKVFDALIAYVRKTER